MVGQSIFRRLLYVFVAVVLGFLVPASVYADVPDCASKEWLEIAAPNDILFYCPQLKNNCESSSNGIYKGAQYSFSDDELKRLWWAASAEEDQAGEAGIKTELSFFANYYEESGGEPGNTQGLIDRITERYFAPEHNHGWFATVTGQAYETGRAGDRTFGEPTGEQISIAKDILNGGNRTIPPEIDEHDSISDIKNATNDGVAIDKSDRSQYISGKTIINNKMGSTYTFYIWANGEKKCTNGKICADPFGYKSNAPSGSYSEVTATNANYAGAQVWSDAEMQAIEANRAIYEEAADKYDFPWQVLAVLHSHETGLRRYNPDNGQGVYQLYSYTDGGRNANRFEPASEISEDEFRRQTIIAAEVVSGMVGDLNESGNIKRLFFLYNGTSQKYIDKALAMGFSEEEAKNGEGSAYVMNRYDEQRDPTSSKMSALWPGRYVKDGVYDSSSTSNGFGAFVQYEALAGSGSYCSGGGGGTIAETAILLSWDGNRSHSKSDPKPEYVKAMKEVNAYQEPCSGKGVCAPIGASCDQFVATVLRYSGADKNFPIFGPGEQESYILNHPDMYMKVETNNDVANLQPGDIFITTNSAKHIYLYVGDINGSPAQASASFNDRTGEHFNGVYFTDGGGSRFYNVYRRINI